jgi:hypothetical protein
VALADELRGLDFRRIEHAKDELICMVQLESCKMFLREKRADKPRAVTTLLGLARTLALICEQMSKREKNCDNMGSLHRGEVSGPFFVLCSPKKARKSTSSSLQVKVAVRTTTDTMKVVTAILDD